MKQIIPPQLTRLARTVKPGKPRSLLLRLVLFIALLLSVGWLAAAIACWQEAREYIDEFYDTRQMLFAKRLAASSLEGIVAAYPPESKRLLEFADKEQRGELEEEALSFAVFDHDGQQVLNDGEEGRNFLYSDHPPGFFNTYIYGSDELWRLVWLDSSDGRFRVAVGQELDYRLDMTWDLLEQQFFPWLLLLPLLLLGVVVLVYRELRPLRVVTGQLNQRNPQDFNELSVNGLFSEAAPLVTALNKLFARTADMFERERAFISDAAHELKTPLTALRIQAEVAGLPGADAAVKEKALAQLLQGIDRSAHLVEQLLNLSRLEAMRPDRRITDANLLSPNSRQTDSLQAEPCQTGNCGQSPAPLPWDALVAEAVALIAPLAEKKHITLQMNIPAPPPQVWGQAPLIALMLRNLLENAVKYTPNNGNVGLELNRFELTIRNSGPGVAPEHLPRLGERFFRPPGQSNSGSTPPRGGLPRSGDGANIGPAPDAGVLSNPISALNVGSGLGLSIVLRVAELHGFKVNFQNMYQSDSGAVTGFCVRVRFQDA